MKNIEELYKSISELRERMKQAGKTLEKISERLLSAEILSPSDYDETLNVFSGLKDAQSKFCSDFSKLSDNTKTPSSLDQAEQLLSEMEGKLNKAPLLEEIRKLKSITVSGKAKEQLDEAINNASKLYESDIPTAELTKKLEPYITLVKAASCKDSAERFNILNRIFSSFPSDLINCIAFGQYEYNADSSKANSPVGKAEHLNEKINAASITAGKTVAAVASDSPARNMGDTENLPANNGDAAHDADDSVNKENTQPQTLEEEDQRLYGKNKITDSDRKRLERLKNLNIKIGLKEHCFEYEIKEGDTSPITNLKQVKKDLERYSKINLRVAMMFSNCPTITPKVLDNKADTSLESLLESGYLNAITREGTAPIYYISPKGKKAFADIGWFSKNECSRLRKSVSTALDDDYFKGCICAENNVMTRIGLSVLQDSMPTAYGASVSDSHCRMGGALSLIQKGGVNTFIMSFAAATDESALHILHQVDEYLSAGSFENIMIAAEDFDECDKIFRYIRECYPEIIIKNTAFYSMIDNEIRTNAAVDIPVADTSDNAPASSDISGTKTPGANSAANPTNKKAESAVKPTDSKSNRDDKAKASSGNKEEQFDISEKVKSDTEPYCGIRPEQVKDDLLQMLSDNKIYCACAYLMVLSKNDPENKFYSAYSKLAYATNDPAFECKWFSTSVMTLFENADYTLEGIEKDLYLSAALRTLFVISSKNDFDSPKLAGMVKASADSIGPEVGNLIQKLNDFFKTARIGIDAYANYRGNQVEIKKNIASVSANAKKYFEQYILTAINDSIDNKRVYETQKMMFDRKSDLAYCLEIVAENDNENDSLEVVKKFLDEINVPFDMEKISNSSIDDYIDTFWDKAEETLNSQQKSSKMISKARRKIFHKLENVFTVIHDWVYYTNELYRSRSGKNYEKDKKRISESIEKALAQTRNAFEKDSSRVGLRCVLSTLEELKARMDGTYSEQFRKMFYLDFLKYNKVTLDEKYLPYNDNDCTMFMEEFSLPQRIISHSKLPDRDFAERLDEIFNSLDKNGSDGDYGSARIIIDLCGSDIQSNWTNVDLNQYISLAADRLNDKHRTFVENLELAQSYGKIDDIVKKEAMSARESRMFEITAQNHNFGHYNRFLAACEEYINMTAKNRQASLRNSIDNLKNSYEKCDQEPVKTLLAQAEQQLELQDYTVVEDIINRIMRDDLDDYTIGIVPEKDDHFMLFLKDFDDIYNGLKADSRGKAVNLKPIYRDSNANILINNFPIDRNDDPNRISALLNALGFQCKNVNKLKISNKMNAGIYDVLLNPPFSNTKQNYKHPIAPFGSVAVKDGFRVVCLYGRHTAANLIDRFKELGENKQYIVLLDYPLNINDRRELARAVKKEAFPKVFITIDPVVIKFLAKNYQSTDINRMLMEITMPFSYHQPYFDTSSQSLPVEMFMGRRKQLNDIKSCNGANIVFGGRQLGKTALLQMARTEINRNENGDRAVYIQVKEKDYEETAEALSDKLVLDGILPKGSETNDWEELCLSLQRRLMDEKDHIPFLLILIDEADAFVESCKLVNYDPLAKLEELQMSGDNHFNFKFVIAGLRNVVRFEKEAAQSNNSVLARLKSLNIAPLTASEARELLEIPLRYLGIRFPEEKTHLISNILAATNYFPGLIHTYCTKLVKALCEKDYAGYNAADTPPYFINEKHFKKVLADHDFNEEVAKKFMITLKLGQDEYYFIIAYILAYCIMTEEEANGFTAEHIYKTGIGYEVKKFYDLNVDQISALMDEMCQLNVLTFNKQLRTYSFARHSFIQLLGKMEEVEATILKFSEG